MDENLFDIAHQWNLAKNRLNDDEKEQLIKINYKAGMRAKDNAAFSDAALFFNHGAELIKDTIWETEYEFAFQFHKAWSESEYLARNFEKAEKLFEKTIKMSKHVLDKCQVYSVMMRHYITQLKSEKALMIAIDTLKELGVSMPKNPGPLSIITEVVKSKLLLKKLGSKKISELNNTEDEKIKAAMELLIMAVTPALTVNPMYVPVVITRTLNLTLKHGLAEMSPASMTGYGTVISTGLGEIKKGIEFSEAAVALSELPEYKGTRSMILFSYVGTHMHLKRPFRECAEKALATQDVCLNDGNFEYYWYMLNDQVLSNLYAGKPLSEVFELMKDVKKKISQLKQTQSETQHSITNQVLTALMGNSEDYLNIKGEFFDEEKELPVFREANNVMQDFYVHVFKAILCYIHGDYQKGLAHAAESEKNADSILGTATVIIYFFYYALLIAVNLNSGAKGAKKYLKKIKKIEGKLKMWSEACPYNYLDKYLLIKAEMSRFRKKAMDETLGLYMAALQAAQENKLHHEAAIINERISNYYANLEMGDLAKTYMTRAYYGYRNWGAEKKVELLEKEQRDLILFDQNGSDVQWSGWSSSSKTIHSSGIPSSALDLSAILKNSQVISQEIKLENLLKKMMQIVIENACAQKGYFLFSKNGEWHVEVESSVEGGDKKVVHSVPEEDVKNDKFASTIANYAERKKESVVLGDALLDSRFRNDPYIKERKPKSILCIPLMKQGQTLGLIYLENNLIKDCFTKERIELLQMLAGHIAISLGNAILYDNLDFEVKERTAELEVERNKLKERNQTMERDIALARKIQNNLIPTNLKHDFIASAYRPMEALGGDFFDIIDFPDSNKVGIFMSDVSGHGVTAAFVTSMIKTVILQAGNVVEDPAKLLAHMNSVLANMTAGNFVTVFYCIYDPDNKSIVFSNAGHNHPYLIGPDQLTTISEAKGAPIGILPNDALEKVGKGYVNGTMDIGTGDKLLIYTDGLTEATSASGDESFEDNDLEKYIMSNSSMGVKEFTDGLFEELIRFKGNEYFEDDVCLICMDIK